MAAAKAQRRGRLRLGPVPLRSWTGTYGLDSGHPPEPASRAPPSIISSGIVPPPYLSADMKYTCRSLQSCMPVACHTPAGLGCSLAVPCLYLFTRITDPTGSTRMGCKSHPPHEWGNGLPFKVWPLLLHIITAGGMVPSPKSVAAPAYVHLL